MIATLEVKCNAAHPALALPVFYSFRDSPSSIRVIDVPKRIGKWDITKVYLTATYPDNSIVSVECVRTGSVWTGTIAGSSAIGRSLNGYSIIADGINENGDEVNGYCLGRGDVVILDTDSTITLSSTSYYLHFVDAPAEDPNIGDVLIGNESLSVWTGDAWNVLGFSQTSLSDYYQKTETSSAIELEDAFAHVSVDLDDYPTKADVSSDISTALCGYVPLSSSGGVAISVLGVNSDNGFQVQDNVGNWFFRTADDRQTEVYKLKGGDIEVGTLNQVNHYLSGGDNYSISSWNWITTDQHGLGNELVILSSKFRDYYTKNETSSGSEIAEALVNLTGYATQEEVLCAAENAVISSEEKVVSAILYTENNFQTLSGAEQMETNICSNVGATLQSYYIKNETSSSTELTEAFSNITVDVDPALRTDIDSKVLVNDVSAQSLKVNIMALSDYAAISGTAAFDPEAFYCISDDTAGGGGGGVDPQTLSNYYTKAQTSSAVELQAAFSTASGYDLGKTYVKYADGSTVAYNLTGRVNGNLSATIQNPLDAVEVRIGSNVTAFGDDGFRQWTSLTAVYYPDSVVGLGDHVFLGDTKLVHVELPDRISSLGGYMFEDCSSLSSLKIPSNLVSLVEGTFKRSTSLKKIEFPESLTSTSRYIFNDTSDLTAVFLGKTNDEITAMANYSLWGGTRLVVSGWIPASQEWVTSQIPTSTSELNNDSGFIDGAALDSYYTKSETSSAAELSSAFANVSVDLTDYATLAQLSSKVIVNEVSADLKIQIMSKADYDVLSAGGTTDPDTFYCLSDWQPGGDMTDYYTKSETSSAAEIDAVIGNINDILEELN